MASSTTDFTDYYALLRVAPTATEKDIVKAWRKLSLTCHPDKLEEDKRAEGEARFKAITNAKDILTDSSKRRAYDATWHSYQNAKRPSTSDKPDKPNNQRRDKETRRREREERARQRREKRNREEKAWLRAQEDRIEREHQRRVAEERERLNAYSLGQQPYKPHTPTAEWTPPRDVNKLNEALGRMTLPVGKNLWEGWDMRRRPQ